MKVFIVVAIAAFACQANVCLGSEGKEEQDPGVVCSDCKGMVGDIKNGILSDKTKNTTTTAVLSLVCGQPCTGILYGICSSVVESAVPFVITAVADSIDPLETCISLSLCAPQNGAGQDFKSEHDFADAVMKKVSKLVKPF